MISEEYLSINPLLVDFKTLYQTAPFDKINIEHYMPAFKAAIGQTRKEIDAIINNSQTADFANTVEALEISGQRLDRISSIFFNLNHAQTSDEIQKLARDISPMLTELSNDIAMNEELFARVKSVYEKRETLSLSIEQAKLLEDRYKGFVRQGANLNSESKQRMREISREASQLSLQFGENVLAATNAFELHLTQEEDLLGIPEGIREAARAQAKAKKKEGWIFTLQYPSYVPFMQYSQKRELREKMFRVYSSRCFGGEFDNQAIVNRMVKLRLEKAHLFGYENYAQFVLEERMALTPENVFGFLNQLLDASLPKAKEEFAELQEFARSQGDNIDIQRWDWAYYAEKLKTQKYAINDEITRPYFDLERVKQGIFQLANQLYGLTFRESNQIPKYHSEVVTYEVFDAQDRFLSVFYADFFPRTTKQGGAWMTSYLDQYQNNTEQVRPHISIVANFTRPTDTKPSLLTFNEVTTFLHEFGHALHGMLSQCKYASLSGTNVYRDFVELPSQLMENFAYQKKWIQQVAKHYITGEKIPDDIVQRIIDSSNFHSGYSFIRQLSFGMVDMAWHTLTVPPQDSVKEFEQKAMAPTELFPQMLESCMSPAFSHIFAGGYAAGYYGYKWAEVLDADAYKMFKEAGDKMHEVAVSFRTNILERGGTEHPSILYKRFRGQEPSVDALLERSGLK